MKLLIDAMGTPAASGGMNLYAREIIRTWSEDFPDDELLVVGGNWAASAFLDLANVSVIAVRGSSIFHRSWTQAVQSGWWARLHGVDQLLSLSPVGAWTFPASRVTVVVHDWRHINRPMEFGAAQRVYRRLWRYSVARSAHTIAISAKTARETTAVTKPRSLVVVPNGNDHARRWQSVRAGSADPVQIVTFGHFVNKRPEQVIEAVSELATRLTQRRIRLVVLGARGDYREELRRLTLRLGVADVVEMPGFVEDDQYQSIIQSANVVVLNSSDEGYGLPVSEAVYFSIPVIVADDSGLKEIHGERVIETAPVPMAIADAIATVLSSAVRPRPHNHRWSDTVAGIRAVMM